MTTVRVSAAKAHELTAVLRKRRSEPTTIVLDPGEYTIELAALIGPVAVIGEAGAERTRRAGGPGRRDDRTTDSATWRICG